MRLLTRCKILDVASFLHCLQIISYGSPQFTDLWITSLLFVLNYKLITRATLLALAKSILSN